MTQRLVPVELLESRVLLSRAWYVAPSGDDGGGGTLAQPFRTIHQAADVATNGDTVFIRAGTYRETVKPASDGVTFEAYNGENVTVSGADAVSGWSNSSGAVYRASMPWDLGEGNNQVFVDGRLINEARWPNTTLDLSHPTVEYAPSVTDRNGTATIYDPKLSAGWTGAGIHMMTGEGWYGQTGTVIASGQGWLTFAYTPDNSYTVPRAGNGFYLFGKFQGLDGPAEWYRDSGGSLYLETPAADNPGSHIIEVKRRKFAFDLSGDSNITIDGIKIFAATIQTDAGSSNLLIDHMQARYLSQFTWQDKGWNQPWDSGIELNGANSTVQNSTIAYSAGDGIYVNSPGDVVQDNIIHDVDYNAGDSAGVRDFGSGATISHNLVFNTGRCGIIVRSRGSKVLSNTVHDAMLQTADGSGIYSVHQDGGGTEIAFNTVFRIHDHLSSPHRDWFIDDGIFLDDYSSNFLIHDNHVADVDAAVKLNYTSRGNRIYNNFLAGDAASVLGNGRGDWQGTVITGNTIYNGIVSPGAGAQVYGNQGAAGSPPLSPIPDPPSDTFSGGATGSSSGSGGTGGTGQKPPPVTQPPPVATPPPVTGPSPVNATEQIPATSFAADSAAQASADGSVVAAPGTWLHFSQIDFGAGVNRMQLMLALATKMHLRVQVRLDGVTGKVLTTLALHGSRRRQGMFLQSARVRKVTGVHDLYLVFMGKAGQQVTLNYLTFLPPPQPKHRVKN